MKKIGIIGAGQAGQRIAVALSAFEDVEVTGIVDPVNGREVLSKDDSEWNIPGVTFYSDDPAMVNNPYDGIIVAADPISVFRHKAQMLQDNGVTAPLLWERPFGYAASHPEKILGTVPGSDNSIISFARFGLPIKVIRDCLKDDTLGDIVDFEIFVTLNCGLKKKAWRHDGTVPQPIHLLDTAFELVEGIGIGKISHVSSTRQDATRGGITYDEKWVVSLELDSGVTGRVVGIQYLGESEFLYSLRQIRIVGTKSAFISTLGNTCLVNNDGSITQKSISDYPADPRIEKAAARLEAFFKSVDGYHKTTACRGEALALAECLRSWVDHLEQQPAVTASKIPAASEAKRFLNIGETVVNSAASGAVQSIGHL